MRYSDVMRRRPEILLRSTGLDYTKFSHGSLAFDYERMMAEVGYSIDDVARIQASVGVGGTPLLELRRITNLARLMSPKGKGARVFVKDEAANPSGSFKDRRASVSAFHAHKQGYDGMIAATSGNYGAAVASQAAIYGLKSIIVQEGQNREFVDAKVDVFGKHGS